MHTKTKWRRFPDHLMARGTLKEWMYGHAGSIGCDHTFVALPTLAMLGSAIGTRRCLKLKNGWREFPVVWSMIVGESGTKKSPAATNALEPLNIAENEQAAEVRYLVKDTTIEALVPQLEKNPHGLLVYRDELSGWFGAMNQYKGKGADVSCWLSMHQAGKITVDRKTPQPHTIRVAAAAVSVTGSIQPAVLQRCLGQSNFENGLAARFLYAQPPEQITQWTEDEPEQPLLDQMQTLVQRLVALSDLDGPQQLRFDPDAKLLWIDYYNRTQQEKSEAVSYLRSALAKLEAYCARFALIFSLTKWADGIDSTPPAAVDAASMEQAIVVADWFKYETARVFDELTTSDTDRKQTAAWDLCKKHGGEVRPWQLSRESRAFTDSEDAEQILRAMARNGLGVLQTDKPNGRGAPGLVFRAQGD